jgi:hypothetical protein
MMVTTMHDITTTRKCNRRAESKKIIISIIIFSYYSRCLSESDEVLKYYFLSFFLALLQNAAVVTELMNWNEIMEFLLFFFHLIFVVEFCGTSYIIPWSFKRRLSFFLSHINSSMMLIFERRARERMEEKYIVK